jgi:hypothetical protein
VNQPSTPSSQAGSPTGKPPKRGKKPKWGFKRRPRKGCVSRQLVARIWVSNKPGRAVVTVLRDGRRVAVTRNNALTVKINVRRLSRGVHTIKLRVRGSDGKLYTKTVRFRRC